MKDADYPATPGSKSGARPDSERDCWLCARPLGEVIEWHHPVPKSRGGRLKVALHPICHGTLHANFGNTDLARIGDDAERLRAHPALERFLGWIAGKPADFHAPTLGGSGKKRR